MIRALARMIVSRNNTAVSRGVGLPFRWESVSSTACGTVSTTRREATSPPLRPPTPSATTNRPSSLPPSSDRVRTAQLSSFRIRLRPGSLLKAIERVTIPQTSVSVACAAQELHQKKQKDDERAQQEITQQPQHPSVPAFKAQAQVSQVDAISLFQKGRLPRRNRDSVQRDRVGIAQVFQKIAFPIVHDPRMARRDGAIGQYDVVGHATPDQILRRQQKSVQNLLVIHEDDARRLCPKHPGDWGQTVHFVACLILF